jgi:hypothetical protein
MGFDEPHPSPERSSPTRPSRLEHAHVQREIVYNTNRTYTTKILYTQKYTRTIAAANMKLSSWGILTSFNILPYAYKQLFSKLSPALNMEKF